MQYRALPCADRPDDGEGGERGFPPAWDVLMVGEASRLATAPVPKTGERRELPCEFGSRPHRPETQSDLVQRIRCSSTAEQRVVNPSMLVRCQPPEPWLCGADG